MATFTTGQGYFNLSSNLRSMIDDDYSNFIDYDSDSAYDLAAFMMTKGNSEEVGSPEFYTWAGQLNPRTGAVSNTTTFTASDTALYVANTSGVRVDDVLHFPVAGADGEHVRVTAIGSGSMTVARLNTTPTLVTTAWTFVILGSASTDTASTSIGATWMEPAQITNRCQLLRRAFQLSRTELSTDVRTAASRLQQKTEQCRTDFRLDLAHTMWFSISTVDTTNLFFTSQGINEQIANGSGTTIVNAGGAFAMANITAVMEGTMSFITNKNVVCFCGDNVIGGLADLGATATIGAVRPSDNAYGFAGTRVLAGDISYLIKFERIFAIIGAPYDGYAFCLDMDALKLAHLKNGKFEFKANIHDDPGGELVKSQFRAQIGLSVTWPKRHGIIRGVT